MNIISLIMIGAVALFILTIGIAFWQMDRKMKKELTIAEYFAIVKGFWAQLFGMFFTISPDEEGGAVVALKNIPPYLMGLIEELPLDTLRGTNQQGEPVLFIRNTVLNQVLDRIHCVSESTDEVSPLYETQRVALASPTVQWVDLMFRFWRNEVRSSSAFTPEQFLTIRNDYQAALANYADALKAFLAASAEEQDESNNYKPWAMKLYGELKSHPDILRVSLTEKPRYIVIYTDDITVLETGSKPKSEGRKPHNWMLGKMIIYINMLDGEVSYDHENGHMKNSTLQAPHVSEKKPCWGSHAGVVSGAVRQKNYLKAIQEAINYLQYANTADSRGASAAGLDKLTQTQIEAIQTRKLLRVEGANLQQNKSVVSTTSFYIIEDNKQNRKVLKDRGIDIALVLDGTEGYGVSGLLIEGKDINTYLRATLTENMNIRTDPTAQDGVRQIIFIEDKEQDKFIELLMDAWKANRTKLPDTSGDLLSKRKQELREVRRRFLSQALWEQKKTWGLTGELLDTGMMTSVYEQMYRDLLSIPEVASIRLDNRQVIITTVDLSTEYKRPRAHKPIYYALGAVRIILDFSLENPIRIERVKGSISKMFMTPQVIGDGTPIWGIKELQLMRFFAKGQWAAIVKECLAFLGTVKDESAAKFTDYLPQAEVLDLEKFKADREKAIKKRLHELPTLLRKNQEPVSIEQSIEKLLNE